MTSAVFGERSSTMIEVDAGTPVTLCFGETLDIADLGASISGDVDDGLWFSMGDGIFLPSNMEYGVFSETVQYQPGPNDISAGEFTLILVSDDPDGNGPMVEVNDVVTITFINAPALVCNTYLSVSLNENCEQTMDANILLANPLAPFDKYQIELFDDNGATIPDNSLNQSHIGMDITFRVSHDCTSSFCEGSIDVTDNLPPFLNCVDATVNCDLGISPETTGFPVPFFATVTPVNDFTFEVEDFDACGTVTLTFNDEIENLNCALTGFVNEVTRTWVAEDPFGNSSSCTQTILVNPLAISDVVLPPNFDDSDQAALECGGDWPMLDNGYPDPDSTGTPSFPNCGNLEATFTDTFFDECGGSFTIVRQWFVIDWCTTQSINHNQIIKISDQTAPMFDCPDDMILSTVPYDCTVEPTTLVFDGMVTDCSDFTNSFVLYNESDINITNQFINGDLLEDLPVGLYQLGYVVADVCGNADTCFTDLSVIDDVVPFAICDGFTRVGVGSNGVADVFATSFDDGSFDNCSPLVMEAAKMTDECGFGLNFADRVFFCCEEIGDTIEVHFRVTDDQGLSNTCIMNVLIEDQLPPEIVCPSDLTVSCDPPINIGDLSDYGQVIEGNVQTPFFINGILIGQNGYFNDNCSATVTESVSSNLDCGVGTITRTFTVTDQFDNSESCTQTITVINDNPFVETDITWPNNFEMVGCDTIQAMPTITGEPNLNEDRCAQVASTFEDQVFYITGGACVKILRTWSVIDWCQFDASTGTGLWTYIQEIKLNNTIAPTILECADQEACSYDENCEVGTVTFTLRANDDCTDSLNLTYLWQLDIDDNGTIDEVGEGLMFDRELTFGAHRVNWSVEDGCGNISYCDYSVTVKDCKNPTPYCQSSITTTIMPSEGEISIWAEDFDLGSSDNCTASEDLIFSFSRNTNDTNRVITCDSLDNGIARAFTLEFWVTDEFGNQERCNVTFIVQDNSDACPDTGVIRGRLAGNIMTQRGKAIPDAEVDIIASIDTFSTFTTTSNDGLFDHDTPEYLEYTLTPHYSTAANKAISTLDLVMIQQHLLGIAPFDNAYDVLASDVSYNDRVSSSDLLIMRKMILGIISDWPNDGDVWRLIDSSHVLDYEYPFDFPSNITIDFLNDTTHLSNFVAVKMGDVNGSYNPLTDRENIEVRSTKSVQLNANHHADKGQHTYAFTIDDSRALQGAQLSIDIGFDALLESDYLKEGDYIIDDNILKIVWLNDGSYNAGDMLFAIVSQEELDIKITDDIQSEVVIDREEYALDLEINGSNSTQELFSYKILQNPFLNDLHLQVEDYSGVSLELFSIDGQLIHREDIQNQHTIIPEHLFRSKGIYVIRFRNEEEVLSTEKVIKL